MANLGFILKENVMAATAEMNDNEFRETITALFNYAVNGELPDDDKLSMLGKIVFSMERPAIDNNLKKWEERRRNYEITLTTGKVINN